MKRKPNYCRILRINVLIAFECHEETLGAAMSEYEAWFSNVFSLLKIVYY
jgi:hypothetical protein